MVRVLLQKLSNNNFYNKLRKGTSVPFLFVSIYSFVMSVLYAVRLSSVKIPEVNFSREVRFGNFYMFFENMRLDSRFCGFKSFRVNL